MDENLRVASLRAEDWMWRMWTRLDQKIKLNKHIKIVHEWVEPCIVKSVLIRLILTNILKNISTLYIFKSWKLNVTNVDKFWWIDKLNNHIKIVHEWVEPCIAKNVLIRLILTNILKMISTLYIFKR